MSPARPRDRSAGSGDPGAGDPLATAYHERTLQVQEARSALGEAVHMLRLELAAIQEAHSTMRDEWKELGAEVAWLRDERARLMDELAQSEERLLRIRNMRVVRWTAGPRRVIHRFRRRGQ